MLAGRASAKPSLHTGISRESTHFGCRQWQRACKQQQNVTSSRRNVMPRAGLPVVCVTGVSEKNFEQEVIKVGCSLWPTDTLNCLSGTSSEETAPISHKPWDILGG